MRVSRSISAGRSYTSCRHSRTASRTIRKSGVRSDGKQLGAALALLPQRCPAPGSRRGNSSTRAAFAEPGGEHRRIGQGVGDELLDVVGEITNTAPPGGSSSVSGSRTMMPSSDAVVAPSKPTVACNLAEMALAHAACTRKPWGWDHPPVAQFVAKAFHHKGFVGGQMSSGLAFAR